jgi:hypothetical protein
MKFYAARDPRTSVSARRWDVYKVTDPPPTP